MHHSRSSTDTASSSSLSAVLHGRSSVDLTSQLLLTPVPSAPPLSRRTSVDSKQAPQGAGGAGYGSGSLDALTRRTSIDSKQAPVPGTGGTGYGGTCYGGTGYGGGSLDVLSRRSSVDSKQAAPFGAGGGSLDLPPLSTRLRGGSVDIPLGPGRGAAPEDRGTGCSGHSYGSLSNLTPRGGSVGGGRAGCSGGVGGGSGSGGQVGPVGGGLAMLSPRVGSFGGTTEGGVLGSVLSLSLQPLQPLQPGSGFGGGGGGGGGGTSMLVTTPPALLTRAVVHFVGQLLDEQHLLSSPKAGAGVGEGGAAEEADVIRCVWGGGGGAGFRVQSAGRGGGGEGGCGLGGFQA